MTNSKLPKTKWWESRFICCEFFHSRDGFCTLNYLFVRQGFRLLILYSLFAVFTKSNKTTTLNSHILPIREKFIRRPIFNISQLELSRKIRRLNIKLFFNQLYLCRCYRCCLNCFLLLGKRASACTFDDLFVRLPSLCTCWPFVCFALVCLNISLQFI